MSTVPPSPSEPLPPDPTPPQPPADVGRRSDAELRAELRRRRGALDADARAAASRELADRLIDLDELATAGTLATYLPTDGELDPNLGLDRLRSRGWRVALPIIDADRSMRFARWDPGTTLAPNRFGIDEPAPPIVEVGIDELDVVLVPCVAVDPDGNRLGFGAGFYDRAFARPTLTRPALTRPAPDATTPPRRAVLVGVVHDVQVVDRIEPDPWDVPMDLIVTGARVRRPRR